MAKFLDVLLDINFETVCRLCLSQNGIMTKIYDDSKVSLLRDMIVSLASVQILPDDGFPELICQTCREKVEKLVKFREQIEYSHYLLCQYIGIDPNDTDNYITTEPGTSTANTVHSVHKKDKSPKSILAKGRTKLKPQVEDVTNSISSLFKDHLVSGISSSELLVNPQDGFINVSSVNYVNITDDSDVYKSSDNYMSIALAEDSIGDVQQHSLLTKDFTSILVQSETIDGTGFCNNTKHTEVTNDGKVYNVTFPDIPQNNLQDIFLEYDNEETNDENGYEDIAKFLKTSQGIDLKKLKDDFKTSTEQNTEIDSDNVIKKLVNRGISLVKTEDTENVRHSLNESAENDTQNNPSTLEVNDTDLLFADESSKIDDDEEESEKNSPDIIFAKMSSLDREEYTKIHIQEEVVPRIIKVLSLYPHGANMEKSNQHSLKFRTYLCLLCLMEFRECSINFLKEHSKSHFVPENLQIPAVAQNKPVFRCEFCRERFNDRVVFVNHQRKHLDLRPFACNMCDSAFWWADKLTHHTNRHLTKDATIFTCTFCSKVFKKKSEVEAHERQHTLNSPLMCSFCDKIFSNIATLKMHRKRHTEGTKHCCEICGKAFYSSTQLKRHEQSHSGVRRFPCYFCDKAFYSNAERRRHLLYHFKMKRFKCSVCEKTFYESGHLNIHMRTHTNFKPYSCKICNKSFITQVKLTRHLKMHQKDSISAIDIQKFVEKKDVLEHSKTIVTPKFTKLNPAQKNAEILSVLGESSNNDYLNSLGMENLSESEEESYIIIEEGEEFNNDDMNSDITSLNRVQAFTDERGQVFYVLDEEFEASDNIIDADS